MWSTHGDSDRKTVLMCAHWSRQSLRQEKWKKPKHNASSFMLKFSQNWHSPSENALKPQENNCAKSSIYPKVQASRWFNCINSRLFTFGYLSNAQLKIPKMKYYRWLNYWRFAIYFTHLTLLFAVQFLNYLARQRLQKTIIIFCLKNNTFHLIFLCVGRI